MKTGDVISRSFQAGIIAGRGHPDLDVFTPEQLQDLSVAVMDLEGYEWNQADYGLGLLHGRLGHGCIICPGDVVKLSGISK